MNKVFVCKSSDLNESECYSISEMGKEYFVVRHQSQVYGYLNRCPHIGAPLQFSKNQFLTLDKSLIQCAMHGALFEIENGHCVGGPCQGQSLQAIDVTEESQSIYLRLD